MAEQICLRSNPGPIARMVGPAFRQPIEGHFCKITNHRSTYSVGVTIDQGEGHKFVARLDDLMVFGNPLPYSVGKLLGKARYAGSGQIDLQHKNRAIALLKAYETVYQAFRQDVGMEWMQIKVEGKPAFEILQHGVSPYLLRAILVISVGEDMPDRPINQAGRFGFYPQEIDWMVARLAREGFNVSLPTEEQLNLFAATTLFHGALLPESAELTSSTEGGKKVLRILRRHNPTRPTVDRMLAAPDQYTENATFRLVRPIPLKPLD